MTDYRFKVETCHGTKETTLTGLDSNDLNLLKILANKLNETTGSDCCPVVRVVRLYTDIPVGSIARLHVQHGSGEEWPVVERVVDGWQTGAHHYNDEVVMTVEVLLAPDLVGGGA